VREPRWAWRTNTQGNLLQTKQDELEEAKQLLQAEDKTSPAAAPTHTHDSSESVEKPASKSCSPSSQEEAIPRVSHVARETSKNLGKQL